MRLVIASDHAGFCLKENIKQAYPEIEWKDFGADSQESVDYPDTGKPAAQAVASGEYEKGILICGSGIGMSIVANRIKGIRAALCTSQEIAKLSRQHNNANILVLPGRFISISDAVEIISIWLKTDFESGRHLNRINKIDN